MKRCRRNGAVVQKKSVCRAYGAVLYCDHYPGL